MALRRTLLVAVAATALALLSGCPARGPSTEPTAPASVSPQASLSPQQSVPPASASPKASAKSTPNTSSASFPPSLRGKDVERIPTSRKVVALTFDAGANADGLASILATLDAKNVPATFFLTGHFADAYPAQSRKIADAGHRLANHTVNHPHLPTLGDAQVRAQVLDAERKIRATTGASPKPLFRFPYGDRNTHTIALVNNLGYACIRWTVDTLGWKGTDPGGQTAGTVTQRVVNAATPGEIVLMHVGSNPDDHTTLDADALPAVIDALRAKGYSFVTLDALL